MTAIRIMTYNIRRGRGSDGLVDPERTLAVIRQGAPDIVALQEIDPEARPDQLDHLAGRLGMRAYRNPACTGSGFLSHFPLSGLFAFQWRDGACLRADADLGGRRLHLFNLHLSSEPHQRREQISTLLGPDLLAGNSLPCPVLVLGDFGDFWWGRGNVDLALMLRRVRRPPWLGTYPARCPLAGRDRAYLRGEVRVLDASVLRHGPARTASTHLPLVLTVKIADTHNYLRVEKLKPGRMEIAPG